MSMTDIDVPVTENYHTHTQKELDEIVARFEQLTPPYDPLPAARCRLGLYVYCMFASITRTERYIDRDELLRKLNSLESK